MLPTSTLLGLACLIANSGPVDTATIEKQLTEQEKAQVAAIIQTGACLPENMEKLLKETQKKIDRGEISGTMRSPESTEGCWN